MAGSELTSDEMAYAVAEVCLAYFDGGGIAEFDVEPNLLDRLRRSGVADFNTAFSIPLTEHPPRNGRLWSMLVIGENGSPRVVTDGGSDFLDDNRVAMACQCRGDQRSPLTLVHRTRMCYPLIEEA